MEWEAGERAKGSSGPARRGQNCLGVRVRHRCGARAESIPVDFKWINTNKGGAEGPRYLSHLMCTEVRFRGVEPICVACQVVSRVEDPFLIAIADVRVKPISTMRRYATCMIDCLTRPKGTRCMSITSTDDVRILGCCSTVGRTTRTRSSRLEDFTEARFHRAISLMKACRPSSLCTVTNFSMSADVRSENMH